MRKVNILFLEMLANVLEGFSSKKTLDKSAKEFIQIGATWCKDIAGELRKIVIEERMENGAGN